MSVAAKTQPDRGAWTTIVAARNWIGAAIFVAALVGLVLTGQNQGLTISIVTTASLWAAAASSWNILAGFGGQMSFGHAAFFGVGAYTMAILYDRHGVSPWIGILAGAGIAMVLALLIGLPTFRLRGPYFALATLALAEAIRRIVVWKVSFTGGADGLGLPIKTGWRVMFWHDTRIMGIIAIAFLAITWLICWRVRGSRFGYFLRAVRYDENAAAAAGVNPLWIKLLAIELSAFLTAIAGGLMSRYLSIVSPDDFLGVYVSTNLLIFAFVGGLGSITGPIVGAFLAIPVEQWLRLHFGSLVAGGAYEIVYGCLFDGIILLYPLGIAPGVANLARRLVAKRVPRRPDPTAVKPT
jgi:branched-chain amino acid transport system permease protein